MARIMVVDDVYTIRLKTELVLRQSGYAIQSCSSGTEAVEAARANRPDAIIMDIVMADMDGFATLRALRVCGITCPIIAYTARRERRDGEFKARGFDAYVPKAENLSGLLALLRILLSRLSRTAEHDTTRTTLDHAPGTTASSHMPSLQNLPVGATSVN